MSIPKSLLNYLQKSKINFEPVTHKTVFTAFDLARTLRVDFKEVVKTLVVRGDNNYYIVMLSAAQMLDFGQLKKLLKVKKIEIAREKVMETVFKIPMGTITPFAGFYPVNQKIHILGTEPSGCGCDDKIKGISSSQKGINGVYKTPLCLDKGLLKLKKIVVGGGSYNDAIKIKPADLVKLEKPIIGIFGVRTKIKLPRPAKLAKKKPVKPAKKKSIKKAQKVKKFKKRK